MKGIPKSVLIFAFLFVAPVSFPRLAAAQGSSVKPLAPVTVTVQNNDIYPGQGIGKNTAAIFLNDTYTTTLSTGSYGLGGGEFAIPRVAIDLNGEGACVYIADGGGLSGNGPGDIAAFNFPYFDANYTSNFRGNSYPYGLGLATNGTTLIAAWTGNGTLESYKIGAGCSLTKGNSIHASGLNGGRMDGLAIAPNGQNVVLTYRDGSYAVVPLSGTHLGEIKQYYSNCYDTMGAVPDGVVISPNSFYVYMDCFTLEYSGAVIDSFVLDNPGVTSTNGPLFAHNGSPIEGSSTLGISNDGKLLYIVGAYSGNIETALTNETFVQDAGCLTGNLPLPGYDSSFYYPGSVNALGSSHAGSGWAVVAEAGYGLTRSSYVQELHLGNGYCLNTQPSGQNPNSEYALSAASVQE